MGCSDLTMFYITVSLFLILTTIQILILLQITKFLKQFQATPSSTADVSSDSSAVREQLTSYELERLEREDLFDKRIKNLKEEVSKQSDIIRRGVPAEELHPLVHNLPHDAVETRYDLPDYEEVAE